MRLLYLRLPEYGPLRNTALAFPRVDVLEDRAYALHFVVGVNGTGKSSALRALYRIFDCLAHQEWPEFDFELAYEIEHPLVPGDWLFVAISRIGSAKSGHWAFCIRGQPFSHLTTSAMWRREFIEWAKRTDHFDHDSIFSSDMQRNLPKGVLAYTSGVLEPWSNLRRPALDSFNLDALRVSDLEPTERPFAWSPREELAFSAAKFIGEDLVSDVPLDEWRALLRKPSTADRAWRTRLLDLHDVRLAGLAVALGQAAHDLADLPDPVRQATQRKVWAREKIEDAKSQGQIRHNLRWLLTAAGLAWPTHIAFTLDRRARDNWTGDTSERLLLLYALAESVAPLPLGQERVVISLHHRDSANIATQLREILRDETFESLLNGNSALRDLLAAIGTPKFGADALLRLLGGRDSNALDAFRTLAFWRDQGLLVDATATFRKIEGDSVVTYENLSDGEQQLLQRGGLLLLLQDAPNHLLLLDEPETHFNDRWKRELIDVIDDNLRTTRSHVVLTTHSSIVLSDAFRDEIIILTPEGVFHPSMPTFGADPSRILQHVFQSPDSIGQRAREALEEWMAEFGGRLAPARRHQLEAILAEIGGGPERIRLREAFAKFNAVQDT
jgi:ABC-type transport system involved in cytochrome c biogenesis ATPase subunit